MPKADLVKQMQEQMKQMQKKIDRLSGASGKPRRGRPKGRVSAATGKPFPGFDKLASSRRKQSVAIIRRQDAKALKAGIAYEKKHRNRTQVISWMQETLDRLSAGLPAAPRRGRPRKAAPKARVRRPRAGRAAPGKARVSKPSARRGRPPLTERPLQLRGNPPVSDYGTWSITSKSPKTNTRKRILGLDDPKTVKALLNFERRQDHPRATTVKLLERRYRALSGSGQGGGRVHHNPDKLPFPEYAKVASSKQKASRAILKRQSIETLGKALAYEDSEIGRVQVKDMIEGIIAQKRAAELKAPIPHWDRVASSNLTETRRILAKASPAELEAAMAYETATRNRTQVKRAISKAMERRGKAAAKPTRKPKAAGRRRAPVKAPSKTGEALPFPGFDKLASSKRKQSVAIIRRQDAKALKAGIAYEKKHRNRTQVKALMQETLDRLSAGLPAAPRRGRPRKAVSQPFPGYEAVSSSDLRKSREILAARSLGELQKALAFEKANQARNQVIALEEALIAKKKSPAGATKGPVEDYDLLPEGLIVSTVGRGYFDDRLDQILAYEQDGQNRAKVVAALKRRLEGGFKGREPWPGYSGLDRSDPEALALEFSRRSPEELGRVEPAEGRQEAPSKTAIAVAAASIADRQLVSA